MSTDVRDEDHVTKDHADGVPESTRGVTKAAREAFRDFEPYDIGFATDATAEHDEVV